MEDEELLERIFDAELVGHHTTYEPMHNADQMQSRADTMSHIVQAARSHLFAPSRNEHEAALPTSLTTRKAFGASFRAKEGAFLTLKRM